MGYMRAHAIIVESWDGEAIKRAHDKAKEMFPWVSDVSPKAMNSYQSFFVPPDGSKEGWAESDLGDDRRKAFKRWLREQAYGDGSTSLRWVEVQFADDDDHSMVLDHDGNRPTDRGGVSLGNLLFVGTDALVRSLLNGVAGHIQAHG